MPDLNQTIDRSIAISRNVADLLSRRMRAAMERYGDARARGEQACTRRRTPRPKTAVESRGRLGRVPGRRRRSARCCIWDTLRQRGNQWIAHEAAGKPPVLDYRYEVIADARRYERPAQLCAGAHHPAARHRRSTTPSGRSSSSIRARATARASAASRRIPRSASRCAPATRCTSSSSSPSRARADARRHHRRRGRVHAHRRRAPSAEREAGRWSAIARAAGR